MDFASCGRGQRPQRHRRASAKSLISCRLRPFLEFVCATLLEAITVEVDWAVIRKAPVQNSVAEILEGIEAAAPRGGQKMKIPALKFAL